MAMEYYSFDNVLNELSMDSDELKRLVSEGQIRAFRDDNRMKFRRDDIDSLKKGKQTEPTIILPEGALDEGGNDELFVVEQDTEDTILDLEGIADSDFATDGSSVPSLDFDDDLGAGAETLTEELVFDEEEDLGMSDGTEEMSMDDDFDEMGMEATQRIDSDAAFLDDDDDFGMQTEPLQTFEDDDADATMVDDDFTEAGAEYEDDEEEEAEETIVSRPKPRARAASRPAPRAAAPAAPAAAAALPSRPVGLVWVILLGFVFVFYALSALCLYDYSTNSYTELSKGIGGAVSENLFEQKFQDPLYKPDTTVSVPDWLTTPGIATDQPVDDGGEPSLID